MTGIDDEVDVIAPVGTNTIIDQTSLCVGDARERAHVLRQLLDVADQESFHEARPVFSIEPQRHHVRYIEQARILTGVEVGGHNAACR